MKREIIKELNKAISEEFDMLEKKIKLLEHENKELRKALNIRNDTKDFAITSSSIVEIKNQYKNLCKNNHVLFENWISGEVNTTLLEAMGYISMTAQRVTGAGTLKAWVHESILEGTLIYQQSRDHFFSVIQIASYLESLGFTDVTINHWNDVDVSCKFNGVSYAFEYERPRSHSIEQIRKKFNTAKQKYNTVYIVCQATDKDRMIRAVGNKNESKQRNLCTRGSNFIYIVNMIIDGNPVLNEEVA